MSVDRRCRVPDCSVRNAVAVITLNLPGVDQTLKFLYSTPPDHLVVFTSIRATDGCRIVGNTYAGYTHTYHPGELSSIRDGATYSFNFEDLPCPPESVHWTRPGTYAPMIAFPDWMTELDPAWKTCDAGYEQGIDPFTAFPLKPGGSGPHEGPPLRRMKRGNHGHGHAFGRETPRTVAATPTATALI